MHVRGKPTHMNLPVDFQKEIIPFLDESQPTPKETIIVRILEHSWEKKNVKSVLNYLFSVPCELFFKDGNVVRFA